MKKSKSCGIPLGGLVHSIRSGLSFDTEDTPPGPSEDAVLRLDAVSRGYLNPDYAKRLPDELACQATLHLKRGSLLVTRSNTLDRVGDVAYVQETNPTRFLPDLIWLLEPDAAKVDAKWLMFYLLSAQGRRSIQRIATGTSGSMKKISIGEFKKIRVPAVPLCYQRAISTIGISFNNAILQVKRSEEIRREQRVGLSQELLNGRRRFSDFAQPWEDCRIGELIKRRAVEWEEVSDDKSYKLLSLRRRSGGPFHRETKSGSEIKGSLLRPLSKNEFLVSKMQVVRGAWKLIQSDFEGFYVSQSYRSFESRNSDRFLIEYFDRLSETSPLYYKVFRSCVGVHIEKMTFLEKFFLREHIEVPTQVGEQRKIVDLIDLLENEIDLLKRQRAAIENQKRGVMERLLSGEVIIPDDVVERLNLEAEKEHRQRAKDAKRAKATTENAS